MNNNPIKKAAEVYALSDTRAHQIVSQLHAPTLSPLSSQTRRDQGRSIISNFMTQVEIFMSTTAKVGLVAVVLLLVGVFGYTQLGSQPADYATDTDSTDTQAGVVAKGSGDVDEAVSAILAAASSEDLALVEELSDADFINADSQALNDLGQSINENDF